MCGIAGIFGLEDKNLLNKMLESIRYRGPDDQGMHIGDNVSIGQVRLSIIDLSKAGRNPLYNENGSIFVVYNGEIYNFRSLRKELEKHGHIFRSRTDSEVIVHAYEEWGINCVKKFNGMFAFALFDIDKKKLFLCRDHYGIKPLFYSFHNDILFFASELRALVENGIIKPQIDKLGLYYGLSFLCTPSPITLYKGIKKILPGHYLEIDSKKNMKNVKYYDLNNNPNNFYKDISTIIKEGEILLRKAIDRMRYSDVPQGVFLSGGIDSSTIVAFLNEMEDNPIETFSIGIDGYGDQYNEFKWARIIQEKFGTNHHESLITVDEVPNLLQQYINEQYDLNADPGCILTYKLAKEAKKNNIKVVHVGEGGDELYCGYHDYLYYVNRYKRLYYYNRLPHFFKNLIFNYLQKGFQIFEKLIDKKIINKNFLLNPLGLLDLLNEDYVIPERGILGFSEIQKEYILKKEFNISKHSISHIYNLIHLNSRNTKGLDILDSYFQDMRYLEYKIRLPEFILSRVDYNTMLSSVEARVPYFDKDLIEYNMSLSPLSVHYKNSIYKFVLKTIMKGKLPKEIIYRRKVGLSPPVFWDKSLNFDEIMDQEFSRSYMKKFFKNDFLFRLTNNKKFRNSFRQLQLWTILNFSFIYRKVILKEKITF